jgi:hypothetical protein
MLPRAPPNSGTTVGAAAARPSREGGMMCGMLGAIILAHYMWERE